MKKRVCLTMVLVIVMLMVAGCGNAKNSSAPEQEPKWKISIEGAGDKPVEFTDIDAKIGTVSIKCTMKKKDDTQVEQQWTGVPLQKVLEYYNVKDYSAIKVESTDGYNKEYTPDLVNSEGTVLGLKVDGKDLDEQSGPVQLVVDGKGANWWIKQVTKITVLK